jgi:hypothetical protein
MSWLYKLLDPMNMSPWKIVLLLIEKYGGDKILYLKKVGLESKSDIKLNPFWRDILLNLSELLPPNEEKAKTFLAPYRKIQCVNFNPPSS